MTPGELLVELRKRDIRLWIDSGKLRCSAPKGALTPELQEVISQHKPQLTRILSARERVPFVRTPSDRPAPLSFAQERIWFLDRIQRGASYVVPAYLFTGAAVDLDLLERAIRKVVDRHEILRTTFAASEAGMPVQVVHDSVDCGIVRIDLPEGTADAVAIDSIREFTLRSFELSTAPLFRICVVCRGEANWILGIVMHHTIADGESIPLFSNELTECYMALVEGREPRLPDLPVQYGDYARWQRQHLQQIRIEPEIEYWRKKLDGAPEVLEFPTDRPRPAAPSTAGANLSFIIDGDAARGLRRLCADETATPYIVLLAVFGAALFRYSGQSSVLIGTPVSDRVAPELENLIGMFANTIVIRADDRDHQTIREYVRHIRETILEAQEHSALPFEKLVEALNPGRSLAHSPLFQVAFSYASGRVDARTDGLSGGAIFDITMYAQEETSGGFRLTLEYSTDLFDASTMRRFSRHYANLVKAFVANPDAKLSELPMLDDSERTDALGAPGAWRREYPREKTVDQLFREQAALTPDAVAIVEPDRQTLTYAELDRRSSEFAARLLDSGVKPGDCVAVVLDRSADAIVAILAVLKSGAAYLPVDPAYPAQRLKYMLEDARVSVAISSTAHAPQIPVSEVVCVDEPSGENTRVVATESTNSESLAYVMYTSGSTGLPKGTCIPHRGIVRLVKGADYMSFAPDDAVLACAPVTFDASTLEIWGPLLNGGKVVVFPDRIPTPGTLAAAIRRHHITTLWLTAGLFQQITDEDPSAFTGLKQLLAGGDVLLPGHVNRVLEVMGNDARLINGYGPTENTTFTCCHAMRGGSRVDRTVPIGNAIANTYVYVLDKHMLPVPVGVPGELYTGGDGLALGYLNRPDLTAERFVPDPFRPGARLYKTGDLVRRTSDGVIEFIGRMDNQIKVRGFRIEPGEVEAVVCGHSGIRECVVMARSMASSKYLVCYAVPQSDDADGLEQSLREYLAHNLPDYMIPSAFVFLKEFPLSENGKINRALLPDPQTSAQSHVAPRTPLEADLLQQWRAVLEHDSIGVTDSFFDVGGHSLLAVRLFSRLEKKFGSLPISMLFEAPTIERMAARLSDHIPAQAWRSLVCIQAEGSRPPLFVIPGVGGNVVGFAELAKSLGPDQPMYGLQSPGLDGKQEPFESIESLAAYLLTEIRTAQPHGPYHLMGACMGGIVVFEMAQQLRAQGESVAFLGMIETWPPLSGIGVRIASSRVAQSVAMIGSRVYKRARDFASLNGAERWQFVKERIGILREVTRNGIAAYDNSEYFRDRVAQANHRAYLAYRPLPYAGNLFLLLAASREMPEHSDPRLLWTKLVQGDCTIQRVSGRDSGELLKHPNVLRVAEYLKEAISCSRETADVVRS